jgi:hypothetical protein
MKKIPTDLEILNIIYEKYYETFVSFSEDNKTRSSKAFVPIDIASIAKEMNVDVDVIFGRLYYHLENKYGYSNDGGKTKVSIITWIEQNKSYGVHFPYLSSILADMRNEDKKYQRAIIFSVISATISIISLIFSIVIFLKK